MKTAPHLEHLHGLDLLRGLAALTLLAWQWPWLAQAVALAFDAPLVLRHEPWSEFLRPVHLHGHQAVGLLFGIAGFLALRREGVRIECGRFDATRYLAARLARRYPLYVLAVLAASTLPYHAVPSAAEHAALPWPESVVARLGLAELAARLAMVQAWTIDGRAHAVDPFDLVSTGWFVALVFAATARLRCAGAGALLALALAGAVLEPLNPTLSKALAGFFLGAATARLHARSAAWSRRARSRLAAIVLTAGWMGLTLLFATPDAWLARELLAPMSALCAGAGAQALALAAQALLMPLLLLGVVLLEPVYSDTFKVLGVPGRLAAGASLVHGVACASLAALLAALDWRPDLASGLLFFAYAAVLIWVSAQVFRRFEWPCARALRRGLAPVGKPGLSRRSLPSS